MDRTRIQEVIDFLDREVPREGARVKLEEYGGGKDEGMIVANESGYLRLGIEFLKAGLAPLETRGSKEHVPVDLEYLVTEDSTIGFDWFEKREPSEPPRTGAMQHIAGIVMFVLFLSVFLLAVLGLITVLGRFRH